MPGMTALQRLRARRSQALLLGGVLIALFGLDFVDIVLPGAAELSGVLLWVRLIGPHWLMAILVVGMVISIEKRPLASIGLTRPSRRDLRLGLLGFVVGVVAFGVTRPIVTELGLSSTTSGIELIGGLPTGVAIGLAMTAGVTEEILFRGYPIERLTELTGRLWVGAGVTFLVFTVAHVPFWGLGGAIQIGAWTLVVTVVYVRTRNLPACILMHIANDLVAFVLLPMIVEAGPPS